MKGILGILCAFVLASTAFGQPASSTWPLTSVTTTTATSAGNVTGHPESFGGMVINNYSGPNNSQRVTTVDGSWPAEAQQNESRYIQFDVSPEPGYTFTVSSITMNLGASGGGNMKANIWYSTDPTFATRTQLNPGVLSLPNGAFLTPSPNYAVNVEVQQGQTLYLRIYPWYTTSSTGKYVCPQDVVLSGTAIFQTSSFIITSVSMLPGFGTVVAGDGSPAQTYAVSGTGLVGDVVVAAPAGFTVGFDSVTFQDSLLLVQSGGVVPPTTIFARFVPPAATGSVSGDIVHTSPGAQTKLVSVAGIAIAPEPTVPSSIGFGAITGTSIATTFTGGNGVRRILVARAGSPVSWEPTDGSAIPGVSSNFAIAQDQGAGNKVVYDGVGFMETITGLLGATTYHVAVYEYNIGTGNSQNYNTISPGIGSTTTLAVPTLGVNPTSLAFGNVEINTTSVERTYTLSGTSLAPASGLIAVTSPSGFEVSTTSGTGFADSISVQYSGGVLAPTTIFVRFRPTSIVPYNGGIVNAGGGAEAHLVQVTGNGVGPALQNEFQAEDAILTSAYVMTDYPGYTGSGYVDMADKNGSAVEFVFSRATAGTDTVRVYFANGGTSRSLSVSLNDVAIGTLSFPSTGSWSTWSSVARTVNFEAGLNRVRFTLTTNNTGPNLDRILVSGQPATPMYSLNLLKSGPGTVTAFPSAGFYEAGTQVTLTALPAAGYAFFRWGGTENSQANPLVLTMNSHRTPVGVMMETIDFTSFPYEASPSGFASVGALGYPGGTTGGTGSPHIAYVTNADDLGALMLRRVDANNTLNFPPLIVYIIGTLTPGSVVTDKCDVKDAYDISIIGVGEDATLSGFGLSIVRSRNIIVRNLKIQNVTGDGISIQANDTEDTGHHVWIDHCSITNCSDGALDVTHTASYVTLSWNRFYNHDKTSLMGHSDSQTSDVNMKVTYHHNYFDSTVQRHPRVRFGKAHVYNNYYRNNILYGVSSNLEADVVVEGCYFVNVPIPTETSRDGSPPGDLVERNNIFVNCGTPGTRGTAFEPSAFYTYTLHPASSVPQLLGQYAGSGKYDFSAGEPGPPVPPAQIVLVSPEHGAMIEADSVVCVWNTGSPGVMNYWFERARDSLFTTERVVDSTISDTTVISRALTANTTYWWKVRARNAAGWGQFSNERRFTTLMTGFSDETALPGKFELVQNYPNPFNPSTTIMFSVARSGHTTLEVFNLLGQKILTLFNGTAEAGRYHSVTLNGDDLPSGIYFYKLQGGQMTEVRKLMLLK